MNLSEYILLPREKRIEHIDLSTPCTFVPMSKWHGEKHGLDFHELDNDCENWIESKVQRCHLCSGGSQNPVCNNPLHFYFGNPSENRLDIPHEVRSQLASGPKSEEHKEKIRQGAFRRPPVSEESRRKQSQSRTGKVQSEQTKQKRSESMKQLWKQRKQLS